MGLFNLGRPRNSEEEKEYKAELAKSQAENALKKHEQRLEAVRERARSDAMPRLDRAKSRVALGWGKFKTTGGRWQAFDAKMEARAKAQGHTGGMIQQGYARDKQQGTSVGIIQQSMNAPQGEGLIVSGLRKPQTVSTVLVPKERRRKR